MDFIANLHKNGTSLSNASVKSPYSNHNRNFYAFGNKFTAVGFDFIVKFFVTH